MIRAFAFANTVEWSWERNFQSKGELFKYWLNWKYFQEVTKSFTEFIQLATSFAFLTIQTFAFANNDDWLWERETIKCSAPRTRQCFLCILSVYVLDSQIQQLFRTIEEIIWVIVIVLFSMRFNFLIYFSLFSREMICFQFKLLYHYELLSFTICLTKNALSFSVWTISFHFFS